jgi:hypothetical protein
MILPVIWIAVCAAAPSVESILVQAARATVPDTSDYRSVTDVRMGDFTTRVSMHMIQAGKEKRWMELDAGGRQSRIVTNGGRSLMTDLGSNTSMAMPSMEESKDPILAMHSLASSRWSAPRALGGEMWELVQEAIQDSAIIARTLVWDETVKEVRSFEQVGRAGDTTRIEFSWLRTGGYTVPSSTVIVQSIPGRIVTTTTTFSDWRFPSSLPSSLFEIP